MAMQRTPETTAAETGRRALLARRTSGRGDEDIVLTRARGSSLDSPVAGAVVVPAAR